MEHAKANPEPYHASVYLREMLLLSQMAPDQTIARPRSGVATIPWKVFHILVTLKIYRLAPTYSHIFA